MEIIKSFLTKNRCFKQSKKHTVKGIMVHSTATKGVMAQRFINKWDNILCVKCVHAFVDSLGIFQTLPWDVKGWHSGTGKNGSKCSANNNGYIGFEICEPKDYADTAYFQTVRKKAIQLCVFLCKAYGLTERDIICHCEGYKLGIASNHGDIDHWWLKYQGYSMDMFRADVKVELEKDVKKVRAIVDTARMDLLCRKAPTADGAVVGKFKKGTAVKVLEQEGAWWKVAGVGVDGNLTTGYCASEYLR